MTKASCDVELAASLASSRALQCRTFTPGLNETAMNPIVQNSNAVIATPLRVKAKEIGFPVYITNPISTAYF